MYRSLAAMLLSVVLATGTARGTEPDRGIVVFAAASLTESLRELADAYRQSSKANVEVSYASSGTLARQIEAGARADVFVSADVAWMDYLAQRHLLRDGTRHDLLANRLVLVAPTSRDLILNLGPGAPVLAALAGGHLALADPDSVPAGRYAKQAFTAFGLWASLEPRIVRAADVRAALAWVVRGEAPLGVVYATDALAEGRVRVVATFPADSHTPIVYPIALTATAVPAAMAFVEYLGSPGARAVFIRHGFALP
jgi:molybdate transport system substrate-binding protein